MADPVQTYQNHTRFFPPFHFFVIPVLLLNVLNTLRHAYRTPNLGTGFEVLVAVAILGGVLLARIQAITVQDRLIRLEMRLRLRGILPSDLQERINDLTRAQLIALRFASDEELV